MKKSFECNESMIITIPIANLGTAGVDQIMPEKFICVFRDSYKIFVLGGKPKPVGAAQAMAGVFIFLLFICLFDTFDFLILILGLPNVLFMITGLLTYAAGKGPRMTLAKLSFSLNILSLFWSVAAFILHLIWLPFLYWWSFGGAPQFPVGVSGLIMSLLVVEHCLCVFTIYWLSKAICRQQFNTLPIILLKQEN